MSMRYKKSQKKIPSKVHSFRTAVHLSVLAFCKCKNFLIANNANDDDEMWTKSRADTDLRETKCAKRVLFANMFIFIDVPFPCQRVNRT